MSPRRKRPRISAWASFALVVSESIRSTRARGKIFRTAASTRWVPTPLILMFGAPQAGFPHRAGTARTSPQIWHSICSAFL